MEKQPSMEDLKRIAGSDAGQRLLALLQRQQSQTLQHVAQEASKGNLKGAMALLQPLLSSDEARSILNEMGGGRDG